MNFKLLYYNKNKYERPTEYSIDTTLRKLKVPRILITIDDPNMTIEYAAKFGWLIYYSQIHIHNNVIIKNHTEGEIFDLDVISEKYPKIKEFIDYKIKLDTK